MSDVTSSQLSKWTSRGARQGSARAVATVPWTGLAGLMLGLPATPCSWWAGQRLVTRASAAVDMYGHVIQFHHPQFTAGTQFFHAEGIGPQHRSNIQRIDPLRGLSVCNI